MEEVLLNYIAQFGAAGLLGLLWILERRHSSQRERELSEAHAQLMRQRLELGELMGVVKDNSVALTTMERGQARLVSVCEEIAALMQGPGVRSRGLGQRGIFVREGGTSPRMPMTPSPESRGPMDR